MVRTRKPGPLAEVATTPFAGFRDEPFLRGVFLNGQAQSTIGSDEPLKGYMI